MNKQFKKGDRVRMTADAVKQFGFTESGKTLPTTGIVAATPRQEEVVKILRDGYKHPDYYAQSFWLKDAI